MTTESQKAFEAFVTSKGGDTNLLELYNPFAEECFHAGYQASEARIRAMLESDEVVDKLHDTLIDNMCEAYECYCKPERMAKAALKAIAERL